MNADTPRLLVVDDEADFGRLVRDVAGALGFEVRIETASRGFRAAFADFQPTVVMLDIVMPDEDGLELLRWLGEQSHRPRIVVVSGKNQLYLKMAHHLGDDAGQMIAATLTKPVPVKILRQTLAAELNRPSAGA